jgi:hypothetical protein
MQSSLPSANDNSTLAPVRLRRGYGRSAHDHANDRFTPNTGSALRNPRRDRTSGNLRPHRRARTSLNPPGSSCSPTTPASLLDELREYLRAGTARRRETSAAVVGKQILRCQEP